MYLRDPSLTKDESEAIIDTEILGALAKATTATDSPSSSGWTSALDVFGAISKYFAAPLTKSPAKAEKKDDQINTSISQSMSTSTSTQNMAIANIVPMRKSMGENSANDLASSVHTMTARAPSLASVDSLASLRQPPPAGENDQGRLHIRWNVNGQPCKYPADALDSVHGIVALKTPLYPTVSLLSEDTRVWCRFCEADIVYRSRKIIGAPPGAKVYCVDGSLLLDEKD